MHHCVPIEDRGRKAQGRQEELRVSTAAAITCHLWRLYKSDILVESPAGSISLRRQEIETVTGYISDSLIHAHFIAVQKDSDHTTAN